MWTAWKPIRRLNSILCLCNKVFSKVNLHLTTLSPSFLKAHDCILLIKVCLKKWLHFVSSFLKQSSMVPLNCCFSTLPLSFEAHCHHFIELLISVGLRVAIGAGCIFSKHTWLIFLVANNLVYKSSKFHWKLTVISI